jgi:hypothetical protein
LAERQPIVRILKIRKLVIRPINVGGMNVLIVVFLPELAWWMLAALQQIPLLPLHQPIVRILKIRELVIRPISVRGMNVLIVVFLPELAWWELVALQLVLPS